MAKLAYAKIDRQSNCLVSMESRTFFGVILISFMEGDRGPAFLGESMISSHNGGRKLGDVRSLFGKVMQEWAVSSHYGGRELREIRSHCEVVDLFSLLCNCSSERDAIGHALLRGGVSNS